MKSKFLILFFPYLLFIVSCNKKEINHLNQPIIKNKFDYIIIGRFCGECGGECATMYKYNYSKDSLFVDHSDSYWTDELTFKSIDTNKEKIMILKHLQDSIPTAILDSLKIKHIFGCPDCTDGCGIYIELKDSTTTYYANIDYQTQMLNKSMKRFAEMLKRNIEKINN